MDSPVLSHLVRRNPAQLPLILDHWLGLLDDIFIAPTLFPLLASHDVIKVFLGADFEPLRVTDPHFFDFLLTIIFTV